MKKIISIERVTVNRKECDNAQAFTNMDHTKLINQLYLGQHFAGEEAAGRALAKKRQSYKSQDIRKKKYTDDFITKEQLLEKLVVSKLRCRYCRKKVLLMYQQVRSERQWTLDRIDNCLGHSNSNTVIACLKCNLERRNINDKKFLFTKQMRLIKRF
jgi:hypothetical protein